MFLLIVLLLFSLALFLRKLAKREGFLQYPALASLVYLIWVIPQLISMHYSAVQFNASELFILDAARLRVYQSGDTQDATHPDQPDELRFAGPIAI